MSTDQAKAQIFFEHRDGSVSLDVGSPLQEVCEEEGVPFACTEGVCGTCVIDIIEGTDNLSPPTQEEEDFLGEAGEERLACQCQILKGSIKVSF